MGMGIAVKLVRIIILSKQQQYPLLCLGYPFWSEQYHFVLKDYMIRQNIVEGVSSVWPANHSVIWTNNF